MRKVHVLKFGGTSLGNGERIRHVARIIASVAHSSEMALPVAVVSAMAGVTDALLTIARLSCTGKSGRVTHELDELEQRHIEAATQALSDDERLRDVLVDLEQSFRLLEADVALLPQSYQGRPYYADASPVAAWGERLSARLLAAAVQDVGLQATAVREEIIVLRDQHYPEPASFGAVIGSGPLLEETRVQAAALLRPLLEREIVPIVPGFIGRTPSGVVKTLGRGGSDFSATLIGAVLDECTGVMIFTDVDGVFSADPRLVGEEQVHLFPRLSYAEASHLAHSGAKVLHPQTLAPVMARRLPVQVRNTFRLHLQGTMIGPDEEQASEPVIAWMMQ
jgi:aspartate kinase